MTLKVLLCAYAADPKIPSEPTIGWAFTLSAIKAARQLEATVTVLTNARSGAAMSAWLRAQGYEGDAELLIVGLPRVLAWLEKPRVSMLARVEYLVWHRLAMRKLRKLPGGAYDVAHHVTFATEMLPSPIRCLPRSVFKIWGPVGSEGVADVYLIRERSWRLLREYFVQRVRDRLSTSLGLSFARSMDLVVTSQKGRFALALDAKQIPFTTFSNLLLPEEIASSVSRIPSYPARAEGHSLDVLCVGHLIPRKRFDLAVQALATAPLQDARLHIVGGVQGTRDAARLSALAWRLGVHDRVRFHGKVDRTDVLSLMARCDVLFHPAGREGATGTVAEAAMVGIPVVCFEGTGAALVLDEADGVGRRIRISRRTSVRDLADHIVEAANLDRSPSGDWGVGRFDHFEVSLLSDAAKFITQQSNCDSDRSSLGT